MNGRICEMMVVILSGIASVSVNASETSIGQSRIDVHDIEALKSRAPILIAHRGGVVTDEVPEGSLEAVRLAAKRGYQMVELDVRESKDHIPVIFHDGSMMEECGIDERIEGLYLEQITKTRLHKPDSDVPSDYTICTLVQALAICDEMNLGVMLDIKADGTEEYYRTIADGLERHNLTRSTVTITRNPLSDKILAGKTLVRLSRENTIRFHYQEPVTLNGRFWFGWPRHITNDIIREYQDKGVLVIPSINVQHYPKETHFDRARRDIQRMMDAGVYAFQIDSAYEEFFEK